MTLDITNSLVTAIGGLQKQATRVAKDATDINQGFTTAQNAAQNAIAADSVSVSDRAAVIPAVEDAVRGAVLSQDDVTTPMVDMLQAVSAYKANAAVVRVTSDLSQTLIDTIGRRGS